MPALTREEFQTYDTVKEVLKTYRHVRDILETVRSPKKEKAADRSTETHSASATKKTPKRKVEYW